MSLAPGFRIGPYEIVAPLGAGGMGEVYRARDQRLGRDVAIKVLPELFTHDRDRLERFEREARLLAALSHPHIAAIYGMEEADSVRGLVLELIEGPTLAEQISTSGALPIDEAIVIARQLADALDAAHERGIVHRDLKPANIKLTHDGQVKVLDFGLAKALDPATGNRQPSSDLSHSPTVSIGGTREGVILGTAAYMSPEQARGAPLDKRTDVWSFGCVLYEMFTGGMAFGGASVSDSIASILTKNPDWSALPSATPSSIRRLLARCLEKDQRKRLRDIGDARTELDESSSPSIAIASAVAVQSSSGWRRLGWLAGGLALGSIVTIAGYRTFGPRAIPDPTTDATIERVTGDAGLTWMPAISPDGKLIAYSSDRAGHGDLDLWIQPTAGGTPLRLTNDPAGDVMPSFSPDGSQIAFRSERDGGGVYIVPVLGGPARLVAREGRWPRFSPDGTQLVYWRGPFRGPSSGLRAEAFVHPLSGSPKKLLADFVSARDPMWSPDGRSLLVLARRDLTSPVNDAFDWWLVPLDGKPPSKTGLLEVANLRQEFERDEVSAAAWTESGVVFAISSGVWRVPLSLTSGRVSESPQRLVLGAGTATHPTVSVDGQLAFAVTEAPRVIERIALDPNARPQLLYTDLGSFTGRPSESADGSLIVFEQQMGRSNEIWIKRTATGEQRMVIRLETTRGVEARGMDSLLSPDGRRIAYTIGSAYDLGTGFVVDVAGGVPTKICEGCGLHGFLSDSRRVLVDYDQRHKIQAADIVTGTTQDLLRTDPGEIDRPHVSPNDRWLAFRHIEGNVNRSYLVPLTPGSPPPPAAWQRINEPTATGRPAGWALDSRTLYLLLDTDGFRCIWGQRIDPASGRLVGDVFAVRHLHEVDGVSTSMANPVTRDGFMYGATRTTGNIWRLVPAAPSPR